MNNDFKIKIKEFHRILEALFVRGSDYEIDKVWNDYSIIKIELEKRITEFSEQSIELINQLPDPKEFRFSIAQVDKAVKTKGYVNYFIFITIFFVSIYLVLVSFETETFKVLAQFSFIFSAFIASWLAGIYHKKYRKHYSLIATITHEIIPKVYFELKTEKSKSNKNIYPVCFEDSIFDSNNDEVIFNKIVDTVYESIDYQVHEDITDDAIKNLTYIFAMHFQVQNGGVIQFVDNSTGNTFYEIMESLKEIDALIYIKLLFLIESAFPNQKVPKNWEDRRDMIDLINENKVDNIPDFNSELFWDELDKLYFNNQDKLYKKIIRYVKSYKMKSSR